MGPHNAIRSHWRSGLDDLVYAQLLASRKRFNEALALLDRPLIGFNPAPTPVEVMRALQRGRVYEQLGNVDRAVDGYGFVVRA